MTTTTSTAALREVATGQPGTAVAKKDPPKDFPAMIQVWKGEIARALPKHLNADRMARVALTCFRAVPKLAECDPKSVFAAVLQAAQLGIEPGLMGEAHLIPFKDKCQLIPGYQGLIKLAKQTGQVVDIYAMAVREKDKFSCTFGLNRTLEHAPLAKAGGFPAAMTERGDIIGVYAVAVFKDGTRTFVLMGKDEIDRVRDGSQGYQMAMKYKKESPWTTHYEEMALKTAIRRLCKTLPKSPELAQALALEDAHNRGHQQNIDMQAALDNSYTPPVTDDVVDVDPTTGEIVEKKEEAKQEKKPEGKALQREPSGNETGSKAASETTAHKESERIGTIKTALAQVNKKDYDSARDLVRGLDDNAKAEIEAAIGKHSATGEKV